MPAWLERAAPSELGVFLGTAASPRKSGLFIRHLCRCFPEVFSDPQRLVALEAADRFEAEEIGRDAYQAAIDPLAQSAVEVNRIAFEVATQGYYRGVLPALRRAVLDCAGAGRAPRKNPIAP